MSDTVWIALIIALAIIVVLLMYRSSLGRFLFRANRDGVEAELQTHERPTAADSTSATLPQRSVNVSGNRQVGRDNEIAVGRDDVNVSDNLQLGRDQRIDVEAEKRRKKKKK